MSFAFILVGCHFTDIFEIFISLIFLKFVYLNRIYGKYFET